MARSIKARAAFQPIPWDLDIEELVDKSPNMRFVTRIEASKIKQFGLSKFDRLVKAHVVEHGKPLVVEGFAEGMLDPWIFSRDWLINNVGTKVENARDLNRDENIPITLQHYLNNMHAVSTRHFKPPPDPSVGPVRPPQRIYLKDIDCPEVWRQALSRVIPQSLFYLNDGQTDDGVRETDDHPMGPVLDRKFAKAGDLMSSLPVEMRAENMMCYIGHEGTYTPAHREMCGSLGHNLMVEASGPGSVDARGNPERAGSSIWFMTETDDRQTVAEYWQSTLGHDIEIEKHFASVSAWRKAPFQVHVVVQEPGDLVLIPSLAPHQVWNRGTRTVKAAWNRTTPQSLQYALSEALPKARMVCRDEQYKNKAIVYYSLVKYGDLLADIKAQADALPPTSARDLLRSRGKKVSELRKDFDTLLECYEEILLSEMWDPDAPPEPCELLPFDGNVTCAYCRCNVFNRFLSCPNCINHLDLPEPEPYDICMDCYTMGRSCYCISGHKWVEQWKWSHLEAQYEKWRLLHNAWQVNMARPLPLRKKTLRQKKADLNRHTLAEVTLIQLRRRPFQDPLKPKPQDPEEKPTDGQVASREVSDDDDDTTPKTRENKRPKDFWVKHQQCHVCKNPHENWKVVRCTKCTRYYCYGTLYRGRGEMPQEIMENPDWVCPHCNGVCFAGTCAKSDTQNPIQPKGTSLSHDTRAIADIRSVETIMSLNKSNKYWIRPDGDGEESFQLRASIEEAEAAKKDKEVYQDPEDEDDYVLPPITEEQIDPALRDEYVLADLLTKEIASSAAPVAPMAYSPDDYDPAATREQPARYLDDNDRDTTRADTSDIATGRKRSRDDDDDEIAMETQARKRRPADGFSLAAKLANTTEAGRQFQKERYQKALEKARQQGRYYIYKASLDGSSRIVKFNIPPASLAAIVNVIERPAANGEGSSDDDDGEDVLRSDVAPKNKSAPRTANRVDKKAEAKNKRRGNGTSGSRRREKKSDETMEINSGTEDEAEGPDEAPSPPMKPALENGRRRVSAYLRMKHGEDADADRFEALPMNPPSTRAKRGPRKSLADATTDSPDTSHAGTSRRTAGAVPEDGQLNGVGDSIGPNPHGSAKGADHDADVSMEDTEPPVSVSEHASTKPFKGQSKSTPSTVAPTVVPDVSEAEANRRVKLAMFGMTDDDGHGGGGDTGSDGRGRDANRPPVADMGFSPPSAEAKAKPKATGRSSSGAAKGAAAIESKPTRKSEPARPERPASFGESIFDRKRGSGGKKIRAVGRGQ